MKRLIFFCILTLNASFALCQPGETKILKVLSWNIYMLPRSIANSSSTIRAKAIGEILNESNYDVIVLQEAFSYKSRKIIWEQLKARYPYSAGPANQKAISLKTNSGIWILSKYPIMRSQSIVYKFRVGWDAFSRKGALLLELDVDGMVVQIVGTHLQSSGGETIRKEQCMELYNGLLKMNQKDGVPQIICGDFNIDKDSSKSDYQFMLDALNAVDGEMMPGNKFSFDSGSNDLNEGGLKSPTLIDYILIGNGGLGAKSTDKKIVSFRKRWASSHQDLSDHYAVEASVDLSLAAPTANIVQETRQSSQLGKMANQNREMAPIYSQMRSLYFSPEYQLVNLDRQLTSMMGGTLSLKINDHWLAGVMALGMPGDYSPKQLGPLKALDLNLKLLGLKFEYMLRPKKHFNLSFPLAIGVGIAKVDSADRYKSSINYDLDKRILWERAYFWAQPGINVETNLTKTSKMFVGVGYRILLGTNDIRLLSNDFRSKWSGATISIGLKLRIFDYSSK